MFRVLELSSGEAVRRMKATDGRACITREVRKVEVLLLTLCMHFKLCRKLTEACHMELPRFARKLDYNLRVCHLREKINIKVSITQHRNMSDQKQNFSLGVLLTG